MKTLSLSELRRVAERTQIVKGVAERQPWKVWYVSASNGDMILGEECITLAVYTEGPGGYPSRLVQFIASGQTRKLRDCCILQANDFVLRA